MADYMDEIGRVAAMEREIIRLREDNAILRSDLRLYRKLCDDHGRPEGESWHEWLANTLADMDLLRAERSSAAEAARILLAALGWDSGGLASAAMEMVSERDRLRNSQRSPLFQSGDFTLASGQKSRWKIECDALTAADWVALALMATEVLPPFGVVEGVPRGGIAFADALRVHATPNCPTLLIAEDVVTTGGSIERFRGDREAVGVAVFCRGRCPGWVQPLLRMDAHEVEQLRYERDRLREQLGAQQKLAGICQRQADRWHAALMKCSELERYASHDSRCRGYNAAEPCICGLRDAMNAARKALEGKSDG